jgi:uncharacterized protein YqhQ
MANQFYYGGQALIEGVLIRGRQSVSVAVRCPDGGIWAELLPLNRIYTGRLRSVPLVRGVIVLVETLVLGIRALNRSAEIAMSPPAARVSAAGVARKPGVMERIAMAGTWVFALAIGIGIFFLVPLLGARSLDFFISSSLISNLLEGLLRLALLVGYIWVVGRMRDIQRVFAYHGAEHMTIHAHEHGLPLEVAHIQTFPTAHPRCGTAFLLTVVVVSILVFALLGHPPLWQAVLSRLALVPVIAGISYELIRLSGAHSGKPLAQALMLPGLVLQRLTTRQPDASQIEVAVAAMRRALAADDASPLPAPGLQLGAPGDTPTPPRQGQPTEPQ